MWYVVCGGGSEAVETQWSVEVEGRRAAGRPPDGRRELRKPAPAVQRCAVGLGVVTRYKVVPSSSRVPKEIGSVAVTAN
jgi:hypothetical protein